MAEVTYLEPQERVVSNPFMDIPRASDSTAISPVSESSGMTNRPLQDSFTPQHHRPETTIPVIEGELVFEEPQAFESHDDWRERQRREWSESDERLVRDLENIDREYDRRIAEIESETPRRRGRSATAAGRAASGVMAAADGYGTFRDLRDSGAGFFEAAGGAAGAAIGAGAGSTYAGTAAAGTGLGATIASGGAAGVAAGAAVGAAGVAGGVAGGAVGGAIGGAVGRAIDDFMDWLAPDEQYNPAEEISGPDIPLDPFGNPVEPLPQPGDVQEPETGPGSDFAPVGGARVSLNGSGLLWDLLSYRTEAVGDDGRWRWMGTDCAGNEVGPIGDSSFHPNTPKTVTIIETNVCFSPDPQTEPTREPKPTPVRPVAPPSFAPGNPFRGLPGFGAPTPDFRPRPTPTGEPTPITDPLEPGNPETKPAPTGGPGDLPAPAPAPTGEPRNPTAPTDAPKNPSAGPSTGPSSGPSGGGSSSGSGSSPTYAPDEPIDYTPDLPARDPEWKPYVNPEERPDIEPIELPPSFEQADTPEKCDPCSKLDEILGLLRDEFSNSIQLVNCEETEATYQDAVTNSGFGGLSATNQLILNGITEIWEQVKCEDEGGYASIPESYLPKAPTIKPQLQVQFKESGKKSGSRWHITIPHFNEAFKDSVNFSPYPRGNVRCVLSLTDNTKIIVNAVNKSAGQTVIAQCLSYVNGQYQTPLSEISYYEVPSQGIREITVEATYCKYFTGTLEEPPKWTRKLPQ